jgi:hypothetical protein
LRSGKRCPYDVQRSAAGGENNLVRMAHVTQEGG